MISNQIIKSSIEKLKEITKNLRREARMSMPRRSGSLRLPRRTVRKFRDIISSRLWGKRIRQNISSSREAQVRMSI